ncbi:Alkanal monooxygenase beta chain [Vibrio chagasii]|uniref:luciferase subunit beta n=1 Tax=Vibrio TaxID=662 RepID=UPI000CF4C59E|nr:MULTISPECIES: alkanal monooxygenase [Vibrio]MCG9569035.1 LLM class flavin-dependent oxidoreductase [Vibrio chagasii]MCG9673017.1 LLM class flavin-dependent oxidoreductase [Vibrio chagasii]NOI95622.1 LLM class flavin-dependent oxidoreductase [Vibrio sp. T3Y01]PQJ48698.1 alkane 1-monooxygenase [Vibrio splendidus]CAH6794090.1 Alkanal monooxygenase beta chain [Vibrio chagasii]
MKFGLFFLNFLNSKQSSDQVIEEMLDTAHYADQLSFDTVAVYENHFSNYGAVGAPLTVAGFLLGMTQNLKVASLNHVITTHHPVRVAEEACLLDQMSEGRFVFGFSDCEKSSDMRFFNRPTDAQFQVFDACYEVINDAFSTGYCHPENDFFSFPKISVNPHAYTEGGPAQFVNATSKEVVEWAAKRGLALVFKWDDSNAQRQEYAMLYNDVANEHGVDIAKVRHKLTLLINQNIDGDQARAETHEYLAEYVRESYPNSDFSTKMSELLSENAIGTYEESTQSARIAIECCGASDVLMSFESIADTTQQRAVIDVVNANIVKYHS